MKKIKKLLNEILSDTVERGTYADIYCALNRIGNKVTKTLKELEKYKSLQDKE